LITEIGNHEAEIISNRK